MDPGKSTRKNINWRYPSTPISTTVLGDSQVKYLFHHCDPNRTATPAFVWQSGARITDARVLLDFGPSSTTTFILNVGTNDLTSSTGRVTFDNDRDLLYIIGKERPGISRVYASLVLPKATNRHYGKRNDSLLRHCNREACAFNSLLQNFCQRSSFVYFIDHGFEWLPSARVLAADGIHPSFEGAALMATHLQRLLWNNECFFFLLERHCSLPADRPNVLSAFSKPVSQCLKFS
ncbi:hypothetical protein MTO96_034721 [Rhipicephalus appendiculatus]